MLNDEGSVKGKGASIMLPPQGNPFAPGQTPPPTEAFPSGAETAPRDRAREDVALMYSGPVTAGPAGATAGTESVSFAAPQSNSPPLPTLRRRCVPVCGPTRRFRDTTARPLLPNLRFSTPACAPTPICPATMRPAR